LCATDSSGKTEPLRPPEGSAPGDEVFIGDLPRAPSPDKKNPWNSVYNDQLVNDKKEATYKNEMIWKTSKGIVVAPNLNSAKIS
jgi:hypothetical protein